LKLLKDAGALRDGDWSQIQPLPAWSGNWTSEGFVTYAWAGADTRRHVVVVNYAGNQGNAVYAFRFRKYAASRCA
jgi:hypothetical protein